MPNIATVLFLSLLLRACPPQRHSPQPEYEPTQAPNPQLSEPAETIPPKPTPESVLSEETAKVIVFPSCVDYLDELTSRRRPCPFEVVYELAKPLSEGRLEVFNLLHVDVQYPLPDLSPGRHNLVMTDFPQGFYWSDIDQSVPDPMLSCSVGETSISLGIDQLWEKSYSAPVYDYKPPTPTKELEHPPDPEAAFRGDDVGFTAFNIPFKRNLQLRDSGSYPRSKFWASASSKARWRSAGEEQIPNASSRHRCVTFASSLPLPMTTTKPFRYSKQQGSPCPAESSPTPVTFESSAR
jgi:hypothetical protein